MTRGTTKAVILARGLGTRMRRADDGAALDAAQAATAATGVKGMMPIGAAARPFVDYLLSALADAGCRDVCLVIGPEHDAVRAHYARTPAARVRLHYAVQTAPRGTADAVLAAEAFAAGERFLVLNADNYYPPALLAELAALDAPGLVAFARDALLADGHIPAERIARFALLELGADDVLRRIVEKPDEATARALGPRVYVSMNCWNLGPEIFPACRAIAPSPRGELELPLAVQYAIDHDAVRFRALPRAAAVLDLSARGDVAAVAARLGTVVPCP